MIHPRESLKHFCWVEAGFVLGRIEKAFSLLERGGGSPASASHWLADVTNFVL